MTLRIEGAIVSEDGMLADSHGIIPSALLNDADQEFLSSSLDQAAILVHGRNSHERQPNSRMRRRLIAIRSANGTARVPDDPLALFWNTLSFPLDEAASQLEVRSGTAAILGGTDVYGIFLGRYDAFHLSRMSGLHLSKGRPVFPGVPTRSTEDVLIASGLTPISDRTLDPSRGVRMTTWTRA